MREDYSKYYEKFLEEWGAESQIVVAMEEMSELTKELCKYKRNEILNKDNSETIKNIQTVTTGTTKDTLYRVTNLGINDALKVSKDGTMWGAIKTNQGTSKMAKLKEVNNMTFIDYFIIQQAVDI